jgi:hypothetical protein
MGEDSASEEFGRGVRRELLRRVEAANGAEAARHAARGCLVELCEVIEARGGAPALRRLFRETYLTITGRPIGR